MKGVQSSSHAYRVTNDKYFPKTFSNPSKNSDEIEKENKYRKKLERQLQSFLRYKQKQ